MDWAEKYRPRHLNELVGNNEAMRQMSEWALNWSYGSLPLILYGKPGIGKTSSAWALANDMNWEVVELNASDQRTRAIIERVAGGGATTGSLSGYEKKLIILDEADNLQGNADRGGARAIVDVIKNAKQPLILIANDLYGLDASIRNLCIKIQFKAMPARSMIIRLKEICSNEGISWSSQSLSEIAENSEGDIRSAVTMLYASSIGRESITDENVSTSGKDKRKTIFDLVAGTLGYKKTDALLELNMSVDESPDTIIQWIESNMSGGSDIKRVMNAYSALSRADIYLGNTFKNQYYTLWRYASVIMLHGVHDALKGCFTGYAKIMPPSRWRQMAGAKRMKNIREELFTLIGSTMHMSSATIRTYYLCPLSLMAKNNPKAFSETFHLNSDHLNVLLNNTVLSKSIIKEIEGEKKKKELEEKKREKDKIEETKIKILSEKKPIEETDSGKIKHTIPTKESIDEVNDSSKPKEKKSSQSTLFSF